MTLRVALVGYPLRRRHSEVMHNAAFAHYGVDARYRLRPLPPAALPGFVAEARAPGWLGFQVTAPHKQAVIGLLDRAEAEAGAIGAVNTVHRKEDGALVGINTDAPGFAGSVRADLGMELAGARVVIVGAGGAARAVVHACLASGAAGVHVGNRTEGRARALGSAFADPRLATGGLGPGFYRALARADLVVNATTVGMTSPGPPVQLDRIPAGARVLDLVYVPAATELVAGARARGLAAVNGLGMLVAQAAIAFERWTGIGDAAAVMRAAVERLDPGRSSPP